MPLSINRCLSAKRRVIAMYAERFRQLAIAVMATSPRLSRLVHRSPFHKVSSILLFCDRMRSQCLQRVIPRCSFLDAIFVRGAL
jgi:hypothetical protein